MPKQPVPNRSFWSWGTEQQPALGKTRAGWPFSSACRRSSGDSHCKSQGSLLIEGTLLHRKVIAKSISAWIYSRLLIMKARWVIFGALFLAAFVSPSAMRAMPRVSSVYPCLAAKSRILPTYQRQRQPAPREVAYSLPGQHRPASRLHRNRGKKISIERGLMTFAGCSAPRPYVFSPTTAPLDTPAGPNPSRGPPAQV